MGNWIWDIHWSARYLRGGLSFRNEFIEIAETKAKKQKIMESRPVWVFQQTITWVKANETFIEI